MKTLKYTVILFLIAVCHSCNKSDIDKEQGTFKLQNSSQKWELVAITSSWTNEITTGNNLDWQEFYVFNPDGTFLKSREQDDGRMSKATGTYAIVDSSGEEYLELIFETGDELRASCSQGKEFLSLRKKKLLNGSWVPCDGPSFEYRLSES